jgi:hypothetical protein
MLAHIYRGRPMPMRSRTSFIFASAASFACSAPFARMLETYGTSAFSRASSDWIGARLSTTT